MTRLLIRNGRVVDPSQGIDQGMDLLIDDGLVAALGEKLDVAPDTTVFDASGLVVAPGFIDIHTHLREPGFEYKETIESGCLAAAAGGFTAVCALANTSPVNDEPAVTRYVIEKAGGGVGESPLPGRRALEGLQRRRIGRDREDD